VLAGLVPEIAWFTAGFALSDCQSVALNRLTTAIRFVFFVLSHGFGAWLNKATCLAIAEAGDAQNSLIINYVVTPPKKLALALPKFVCLNFIQSRV